MNLSLESLTQGIHEDQLDISASMENIERNIIVLEQLQQLQLKLKDCDFITKHDRDILNIAAEMTVAGTTATVADVFPALESFTRGDIAAESIGDTVSEVARRIGFKIKNIFKNIADSYQTFYLFYEKQSEALNELKYKINKIDKNEKVSIQMPNNKYIQYSRGDIVKDANDYAKRYTETSVILIELLKDIYHYQLEYFIPEIKEIRSDSNYKNSYLTMVNDLKDFLDKVTKIKGMQLIKSGGLVEYYETDNLLGMSKIFVAKPSEKEYDSDDYKSARSAAMIFDMHLERTKKFNFNMHDTTVHLDGFTGQQLIKLIDVSLDLIEAYKPFISFQAKLMAIGNNMISNYFGINPITLFIAPLKLCVRVSSFLNDLTASSLVFSRGTVSNLENICERVHAKLK